MRGTGRTPDTSLYKPRPISAPKARASETTSSTTTTASTTTSSSSSATVKLTTTTASTRSAAAMTTVSSRSTATPASSNRATATTAGSSTRAATATAPVRSTRPTASASRPVTSAVSTTTSRLSRTTPSSTTAAPAKPITRTSSSARLFKSTTTSSSAATSRTTLPVRPTSASAASKRLAQAPAKSQPTKQRITIADSNQDDRDDVDSSSRGGGYPECMEIESFEDAASAIESAFSMLSGAGELNIITAVRLRPMSTAEKQKGYRRIVDMAASEGGNWVRIVNPVALAPTAQYTPPQSMRLTASSQRVGSAEPHFPPQFTQEFHFDHTFWSFDRNPEGRSVASQSTIYDELGVFTIENALLGYNCSIFAYGQTSAGKTYTMMGSEAALSSTSPGTESNSTTSRRGLTPRICRGLFDRLTEESSLASDLDYSVHVSYIEIYHERAYDLLAQAITATGSLGLTGKESLKVRESPETGVYVEHANQVRVTSFDDIKVLIDEGNRVRSVAATSANQRSSRSHAVLTLYLKQTSTNNNSTDMLETGALAAVSSGQLKKSKICLVDLAGSERADVSGANGVRLREAGSINKSLATLADVISALSRRATSSSHYHQHHSQPHEQLFVPYRNSILTRLLKESLGGNAKTIMLAAISPCCAHYDESLSTLKYIERAKSVVNVNVRVNASREEVSSGSPLDMVESLRREIQELKAQQLRTASPGSLSVCSTSSMALIPASLSIKKRTLALYLDDGEPDGNTMKCEPLPATESLEAGEPQLAESPLYTSSLCFDEKEKAKLERKVAKLRAQLRKKESEFQLHEIASKALSDRVSAQVLKQQAHVINLLGLHTKFLGLAKLRALDRWRFNVMGSKAIAAELNKPEVATVAVPGINKYVMTDSENNEEVETHGTLACPSVDLKCPGYGRDLSEDEENPACSIDGDDTEAGASTMSKPGLKKRNSSHGLVMMSLLPQLEANQHSAPVVSNRGQVDVICSSVITDFFGDSASSSLLILSTKSSKVPEHEVSSTKKSIKSIKSITDRSGNNNQLSPDERDDPSDDIALEIETDDDEEFEDKAAALIDEIIDHEAESNQVHEIHGDSDGQLKLDEPDEPNEDDLEEESFEDEDPDDEECDEAEFDSPTGSSSSPKASPSQRVQSKLARCLDAIDIGRKAMGPTVRKLKQLTDKSSSEFYDSSSSFQVGTGMERQLLVHADKSLAVVNHHLTDLNDSVTALTESNSRIKVSLYDKFEGLLSDFCLQTLGHVCDGLTSGAAGTCSLARGHIEKQIEGFQAEVKELVSLSLGSHESSNTTTMGLLVLSLIELFGLGERIKFAWYAIDQKNRQRMAHFKCQQQFVLVTGSNSPETVAQQQHLKVQALETQAQYDALLARFEAQTSDFAKREEEDRLALLLGTHRLEQEHKARISELEQELEASHESISELEERLLAQMSRVELLEQELELTAVVRSTNELLLQHHHGESSGDALSLSASSPPSSSIIVKLEEELASALIQINELEANKGLASADIVHGSRRNSIADVGAEAGADGGNVASIAQDALDETCSTLADREMLEYMERTSEIEKQNNEAISKLNAAMGERRQQHLSVAAVASDLVSRELEEGGRSGDDSTVARLKQELEAALARADVLEDQHLKLMVSFEHQTDTVLHLEEELYDAQVRGKLAEDSMVSLQERVRALELELSAAQELAGSLKSDMKDVMSELCVTECKCAALEASCAELRESCDASALRVESLDAKLLENASEADTRAIGAEQAVLVAEERCKELKTVNALLENRCNELEYAKTATTETDDLLSAESTSHAADDMDKHLAGVEADKLELEARCKSLLEQLTLAQTQQDELEERWRFSEEHSSETNSGLAEDFQAERLSNARLTGEIAELKTKVGSLQVQMGELKAVSAASQALATELFEAELTASAQQIENLLAAKQVQEDEINSLTNELETTLERTLDLETQYLDLLKIYEELKETHEATVVRCAELEITVAAQLRMTKGLETQVTSLEMQRNEARSQEAELELQLSDLRTQNAELESHVTKTRAERSASQAQTAGLKAQQLELLEKCRFFRELSATQKTKVTSLSEELRAAYAQYDQLALEKHAASNLLAQSMQIYDLESQVLTISSQLQSAEAEKVELSAFDFSHVARIQELEQECVLKTGMIAALETELGEAIASCISLNNNISSLEEQLSSMKRGREQEAVEHQSFVASLKLDLQAASEQIATLQAAVNQSERELEHRRLEATVATSEEELMNQAELMQAEHDVTKHHLEQLQAEYQDVTHSNERALAELQAELIGARSRIEDLGAELLTFKAELQVAAESQQLVRHEQATLVVLHEAALEAQKTRLVQLAHQEREAAVADITQEFESKIAVLDAKFTSKRFVIQDLEQELENAQIIARQSEETLDSQTLQLAEAEESLAVANARAHALENQLQETNSLHGNQLEELREELLAESEAQLTIMRHKVELNGAEKSEANASRILNLERELSEKCSKFDKVSGELELQMSMASEHLQEELNEAASLAKHWEEQHETRTQEIRALQSDFDAKIALLDAEISEREHENRVLREAMERSQSSYSVELKQQESRYNSTVSELRQEIKRIQAVARDWELKYQELNACVSPDAVHKVWAQIEAAKAHADECEATYRVELENTLQLEFDLASVKKELHVTKQQLVELQCKEFELSKTDPSGAVVRSQARQNELAAIERERQELQEKFVQIAKREAAVKLLEASANARFEDLQAQHQRRVRELEVSSKADQAQALLRVKDLETQLAELTHKLCEANYHGDMQGEKLNQDVEASPEAEQARALLRIENLEVNVTELTQKLVEANCRGDMQGEELHSFRSWSALQELLNTEAGAIDALGIEDEECGMLGNGKKKLSPEARRLVLKHLNSLDTWFERAILGKTSSDAGRSERRASLLAILESSDHGFTDLLTCQQRQASADDEEHDDDDGCIDASDAEAVHVELDDLGDELLAMCSVDTSEQKQQQESTECDDLDAIFDHDVASRQFQEDARESKQLKAETQSTWSELCRPSTNPFDNYCLDARDGLSEVAQLRLTVLKLKQVLDAKEEAILFLDDKMRYYEELLNDSAITTTSTPEHLLSSASSSSTTN